MGENMGKQNTEYKVTVILPSLNVVNYIDQCISSVLSQTLKELEIICVDAGSTDGTWEKLCQYEHSNSNIVLVKSQQKSYGYQVNLGIEMARGQYVAILETDDYVESEMYSKLYKIASKDNLDFVKGRFRTCYTLDNGKTLLSKVSVSKEISPLFDNVITPQQMVQLYTADGQIWSGIYRKEFLVQKGIRLNETAGAAYQDIGFTIQVIACAETCCYIGEAFYNYRISRAEASSYSVKALRNTYVEFERLLNDETVNSKMSCEAGLYHHMAMSFVYELKRVLKREFFNLNSEYVKEYYDWFCEVLGEAIAQERDKYALCEAYPELHDVINNINELLQLWKEEDLKEKIKDDAFVELVKKHDKFVVFGMGAKGKEVLIKLNEYGMLPVAVCDNAWKQPRESYEIEVISPEKSVKLYTDALYIVASKFAGEEMQKQLLELGISIDRIYRYEG